VLDGRLYRGASGIAGELGHVLVVPDGEVCRCGNRGCLRTCSQQRAAATCRASGFSLTAGGP
jgi:predicted NBD/HSP70 family sugar kinase